MDQNMDSNNPLLNTLVLKKVFEYLDHPSLMEVRSVCHLWDEEAAPILMKRSYVVLKSACELNVDRYRRRAMDPKCRDLTHLLEHDKLKATLDKSTNPGVIFQNAVVDFVLLKDAKILGMLEQYGHLMKSVVVRNCHFFTHFNQEDGDERSILRGKDELQRYLYPFLNQYCPNLIHLKLRVQGSHYEEDEDETPPPIMKMMKELKVETIKIYAGGWGTDENEFKVLLEVIKASPKLKALNQESYLTSLNFCEGISTLKNVKNLEKFGWVFPCVTKKDDQQKLIMDMVHIISNLEMKNLRILSLSNLTLCRPNMVTDLLEFFKRNGRNLSTLTLRDVGINFDEKLKDDEPLFSTMEFQEILRYCPSITSIDIKAKLIDMGSLNLKPYPSLTKLTLSRYTLKNVESFKAVVEWFPNLVYLNMDNIQLWSWYQRSAGADLSRETIGHSKQSPNIECDVMEVIETFEGLQKLQELVLRLEVKKEFGIKGRQEDLFAKVIEALASNTNIPGLKKLKIIDAEMWHRVITNERGVIDNSHTIEDLRDGLMQTNGFDCVRLENFVLDDEQKEIPKFISENNLPVKFVPGWRDADIGFRNLML